MLLSCMENIRKKSKRKNFIVSEIICNNKPKQLDMDKKILLVDSEAKLPPLKEAGLGQDVCFMCLETTC